MFEVAAPNFGNFEMTGERRICLMAAQPNRYPTVTWRKSSFSGADGGCVEVAQSDAFVLVRDSRNRSGAVLELASGQWLAFLRRIKDDAAAG